MKKLTALMLTLCLLLPCAAALADSAIGRLNQQIATRSGPGTEYFEPGSFLRKGDYVTVHTKVWDSVNEIWWVQVEFTEGGWAISYCVPVSFLHRFFPEFEAKEGAVLHANLYKCGDKTVKPHYLSWNPIELEDPAFHCPEYFGELVLGGE